MGKTIVAVSVDNKNVSMHFGRCEKYCLYEIQDEHIVKKTEVKNPGHEPFFLPKFLSEKRVDVLITGGIGPRAIELFKKLNIKIITNVEGKTEKAISDYLSGKTKEETQPCEQHQ